MKGIFPFLNSPNCIEKGLGKYFVVEKKNKTVDSSYSDVIFVKCGYVNKTFNEE